MHNSYFDPFDPFPLTRWQRWRPRLLGVLLTAGLLALVALDMHDKHLLTPPAFCSLLTGN